jgi:citrate lyase subunit beta / citryl-CoA lyase
VIPSPALLFCPADRPDRFQKAVLAADAVIIDLEDAVAPADKSAARLAVLRMDLDPSRTIVRVNPVGTTDHELDVAAVERTPYRQIMLAKTESAEQLEELDKYAVLALVETALGVENVSAIAQHPAVVGVMWGAEDLVASMNGRSSRFESGRYRDVARFARSRVLVAAKAAGKTAVDAVHINIADEVGLRLEAEDAVASGFDATACIHPSQVSSIREAYAPTEAELTWATTVLEMSSVNRGVFSFEGRMVDEPLLRQARAIVARR